MNSKFFILQTHTQMVNYTIVACQRKKGSLISEAIYAQHVLCSTSARCQKPHGFVSLKVIKKITKQLQCSVHYIAHWLVRFSNDNNLGIFLFTNYNLPGYLAEVNSLNGTHEHELVLDWWLLNIRVAHTYVTSKLYCQNQTCIGGSINRSYMILSLPAKQRQNLA